MNNQTSTQKGNTLEKKSFDLLKEMLDNDEFFVSGKKSKIFWKKPYYSEKRKGNITFDVTIETYLNNADNYSLLTIIECKNLQRKVTVDDIEEFNSKIGEIGEHNTKGIIITSGLFQIGAYNYAVSQKIGLVRLTSNDKFEWINYRKDNRVNRVNSEELSSQFIDENKENEKFIANINNRPINNFADLLLQCNIIDFYVHKEKFINIPFVGDKKIDEIINRLTSHNVYDGLKLSFDKLCNFLSTVYPITFDFEKILQNGLLGKIEFDPLKITISKTVKEDVYRWRFTLAHEIGHLILHYKILKDKLDEKTDTEFSISFRHYISEMTSRRLELQANIFASHLLLPFTTLIRMISEYFIEENIHKDYLYLDSQPINQKLVFTLLSNISNEYQVSLEVAKIRLISLGLLQDETDNSLKAILKRIKSPS